MECILSDGVAVMFERNNRQEVKGQNCRKLYAIYKIVSIGMDLLTIFERCLLRIKQNTAKLLLTMVRIALRDNEVIPSLINTPCYSNS